MPLMNTLYIEKTGATMLGKTKGSSRQATVTFLALPNRQPGQIRRYGEENLACGHC